MRCQRNLHLPLSSRFHNHHIAKPVLQRGARRTMLLNSLDKIRHLPEERIRWLERHRLAIMRDAPSGRAPESPSPMMCPASP